VVMYFFPVRAKSVAIPPTKISRHRIRAAINLEATAAAWEAGGASLGQSRDAHNAPLFPVPASDKIFPS
jgi:hypothetical protein